jgi:hypothetical protein
VPDSWISRAATLSGLAAPPVRNTVNRRRLDVAIKPTLWDSSASVRHDQVVYDMNQTKHEIPELIHIG